MRKKLTPLVLPHNPESPPVKFTDDGIEVKVGNNTSLSLKSFNCDVNTNYIEQFNNVSISNPSLDKMENEETNMSIQSVNKDGMSLQSLQNIGAGSRMSIVSEGENYNNRNDTEGTYTTMMEPTSFKVPAAKNLNKTQTGQKAPTLTGGSKHMAPAQGIQNPQLTSSQLSKTQTKEPSGDDSQNFWKDQDCKNLLEGSANKKDLLDVKPSNLKRISVLGHGSQGYVEKRLHEPTGTLIALKSINFKADENFLKALTIELDTLRACDSEFIVKCHGTFYQQGVIGICLEFMDMGSLADIIQTIGPMNELILGYITYQCLRGLEYLHKEKKVIHRDIKPSNLLVNSKGQVKIADFGVSGKINFTLEQKKTWVGTVTYMSPERFQGHPYMNDTDLWSLGLSIVECALGRYPYHDAEGGAKEIGYFDLMDYILTKPAPKLPATCSEEMKDFISICLRKQTGTRTSASDLLKHPFVKNYATIDCEIFRKWLENVYDN
jgi:exonuclease 3'-5' domain-containing protein 1